MIRVVGVEEDDDVRRRMGLTEGREAREASGAVPRAFLANDVGTATSRGLGGSVGRAVVHDEDAPQLVPGEIRENPRQRGLLVEGRDDDVDEYFRHDESLGQSSS